MSPIHLKSARVSHQYSYCSNKTAYTIAAHKSGRNGEGGRRKGRSEEIKKERAQGYIEHKRGLHSFALTSAQPEVEPPVSLLNCRINLCGNKKGGEKEALIHNPNMYIFPSFLKKEKKACMGIISAMNN